MDELVRYSVQRRWFSTKATNEESEMNNVRILVLQRGWVVVGNYSEHGDECVLTDASVIRRWGTTKGLGELRDGPLEDTVLDPCGTVRAHKLAVVMQIECPTWSA